MFHFNAMFLKLLLYTDLVVVVLFIMYGQYGRGIGYHAVAPGYATRGYHAYGGNHSSTGYMYTYIMLVTQLHPTCLQDHVFF